MATPHSSSVDRGASTIRRKRGMNRCIWISVVCLGTAVVSAQSTIDCYTGMKEADTDTNHALDWNEYQALLATFARLNFGECESTASRESTTMVRAHFMQSACSCSNYQTKRLNTTIPLPECSCSEENATIAIPGFYHEPYNGDICQGIDSMLDTLCNAMAFQPKPLRTNPAHPVDVAITVVTHHPTSAPIAVTTEQTSRRIPLVVSASAVLFFAGIMVYWYRRREREVQKLRSQYDEKGQSPTDRSDDNERARDAAPLRHQRSMFSDHNCTASSHPPTPLVTDTVNAWSFGNNTTPESMKEIYIIEEDDDADFSTYLEEGLCPSNASSSLPHDIVETSPTSRQLHLADAVDSLVSENHPYRSSSGGWMTKSFDKRRFDGFSSSINYNDVGAAPYASNSSSDGIYRTDLIDQEVDDYGSSTVTMHGSIHDSESQSLAYSTDEDDVDDDEDEDDEFDNGPSGPIDLDDGEVVPQKRQSKALRSHSKKKHTLTKMRSVKGARAAYMKQAQQLSSNSLKPIPESTFVRSKPFVI